MRADLHGRQAYRRAYREADGQADIPKHTDAWSSRLAVVKELALEQEKERIDSSNKINND